MYLFNCVTLCYRNNHVSIYDIGTEEVFISQHMHWYVILSFIQQKQVLDLLRSAKYRQLKGVDHTVAYDIQGKKDRCGYKRS